MTDKEQELLNNAIHDIHTVINIYINSDRNSYYLSDVMHFIYAAQKALQEIVNHGNIVNKATKS